MAGIPYGLGEGNLSLQRIQTRNIINKAHGKNLLVACLLFTGIGRFVLRKQVLLVLDLVQ